MLAKLVQDEVLAISCFGKLSGAAPDHRVLTMMREAKERRGSVQIRLKCLSGSLRTCERHLGRLFQQVTGLRYREYLRSVRMHEAKVFLLRSSWSVHEIAFALGYEAPANFTNEFRRCFGVSPREFRNGNLDGS